MPVYSDDGDFAFKV